MTLISAVMVTCNERGLLEEAIRSLQNVADEVVVGDMHSTDGSAELAASLGARVIEIPRAPAVEQVRPGLVEQARGEWILLADPDEVISPRLAITLREAAEGSQHDSVEVVMHDFMMGRRIRGSGWGPAQERHVRMFRRSGVRLSRAVHSAIEAVAPDRVLRTTEADGVVYHYAYVSWEQFVEKMNRYTTLEAADIVASGRRPRLSRLVKELVGELYYRGLRGRAWRDGWRGLCLLVLMLGYRTAVFAKAKQALSVGSDAAVVATYKADAQDLLRADGQRRGS